MKTIQLTQGKVATVDDEDFNLFGVNKWHASRCGRPSHAVFYAMRTVTTSIGHQTKVLLHRAIMHAPSHLDVDHINGNSLDNRRCNLRLASKAENTRNRRKGTGCSSKYKGVFWHKHHGKWNVQIKKSGKKQYLGAFKNENDAANAYDRAAIRLFGKFALTNRQMDITRH